MIAPELLAAGFEGNLSVIRLQCQDIPHADSLTQPTYNGNCLNWVIGHIVAERNRIHALLDLPPVWEDAIAARYRRGSAPVTTDGPDIVPLDDMLAALDQSTAAVAKSLRKRTLADMNERASDQTLGHALLVLYWHESYHTGQTEILRQVSGKNDALI